MAEIGLITFVTCGRKMAMLASEISEVAPYDPDQNLAASRLRPPTPSEEQDRDADPYLLRFKNRDLTLFVDRIGKIIRVPEDSIRPLPDHLINSRSGDYFWAAAMIADDLLLMLREDAPLESKINAGERI